MNHLRKPFRQARQLGRAMPERLNRLPLIPAAAIGAASVVALSVGSQPSDANPAAEPAQRASVIDLPAGAHAAAKEQAEAPAIAKGGAGGKDDNRTSAGNKGAVAANPFGIDSPADEGTASTKPGAAARHGASVKSAGPAKGAASAKPVLPIKPAPGKLELYFQYRLQTNGWYCGPAATRMAVSARGHYPSQDALAKQLGTTVNGTNSVTDISRVLNAVNKTSFYHPTKLPAKPASGAHTEKLRADVVHAVRNSYPVVMNVVGTGVDTKGGSHTFDGGHYITVVGYADHGRRVKIGDSANPATSSYWMSTKNLANWAGERGYAS